MYFIGISSKMGTELGLDKKNYIALALVWVGLALDLRFELA